ncbi:hypothetical protein RWE15_13015 [Virgibacillus halophilus]|uniref:Uncharacterized protein n=1 Tax=Tigheibacillus halophilus TaxID=361280 RepID=A0ABU5C9D8_9BACI|nr:hypothetical protein [Virgibacillus halophilus]
MDKAMEQSNIKKGTDTRCFTSRRIRISFEPDLDERGFAIHHGGLKNHREHRTMDHNRVYAG